VRLFVFHHQRSNIITVGASKGTQSRLFTIL